MLWWFIGAWIASGAVVPISWLLSVARRGNQSPYGARWLALSLVTWAFKLLERRPGSTRSTARVNRLGRYMLSGLASVGALVLLYVGSFSASNQRATSAVAHAPAAHALVAEVGPIQPLASATSPPSPPQLSVTPAQTATGIEDGTARSGLPAEPESLGDAEQVAPIQPRTGDAADSTGDDASHRTEAPAPQLPAAGALLTIAYPKVLGTERGSGRGRARGPLARPYAAPASRGTWLFPPATNAGANS